LQFERAMRNCWHKLIDIIVDASGGYLDESLRLTLEIRQIDYTYFV